MFAGKKRGVIMSELPEIELVDSICMRCGYPIKAPAQQQNGIMMCSHCIKPSDMTPGRKQQFYAFQKILGIIENAMREEPEEEK
jgi:hypothetical protein